MTKINQIHITINHRKPNSLIDALSLYENIEITRQHLATGDYEIDGRLLIERKNLQDLINSIKG